ncbi:MAG TPA: galactosyldiacylglycerol synthase [Candidatus Binatia bacterium]|nr:galactosyldiacylglycerol synthase [Candidatus Binatia bacterium]
MIKLYVKETGEFLGTITDKQLQFLIDQLEEESADDTDYYITTTTVELLEQAGADPALVTLLRQGLGEREGVEVRWEREG